MSQGKNLDQENGRPTDELQDWDAQLEERANALILRQMEPLKAEIESFQSTIAEMSSRLMEKANAASKERDTSDLIAFVKLWMREAEAKNERDFQARLEEECEKAASAARQEAEQDFNLRLEDARLEWEIANQEAGEQEFQKRLEQAVSEAIGVVRREAESQIEELHEQLEASRKALTLAVAAAQEASAQRAMFDAIKIAVDDLDAQRTQSETLSSLVYNIAQFAPRVVFFVMKGGNAVGWKAFGFENGLNDESVRLLSVPTANSSLLSDALTTFATVTGQFSERDNSSLLGSYGLPAAERAIAVPLVVRGKAAAVLYADSGSQAESAINIPAIETLMRVASMGIELLPARRGLEPPRPPLQAAPKRAAASAPGNSARTGGLSEKSSPQSSLEPSMEKERIPAVEVKFDPPAEQSYSADRLAHPEPAFEGRHTGDLVMPPGAERFQMDDLAPEPAPRESLKEEDPSTSSSLADVMRMDAWPSIQKYKGQRQTQDLAERAESMKLAFQMLEEKVESLPSKKSSPLAPPEPLSAPKVVTQGPSSETEQRAHNDARRFARLLVSEIKLYNATKVNEGRRNFDLYPRLKDEIDRSRKVYDKRVAPSVAGRFDYFYDELVQTLAEGDPEKLGPDCPGPLVIAS